MTETSSLSRKPSLTMPTITVCSPPLHCRMDLWCLVLFYCVQIVFTQYLHTATRDTHNTPSAFILLCTNSDTDNFLPFCHFPDIERLTKYCYFLRKPLSMLQRAVRRSTILYLHIIARGLRFLLPSINHVSWTPSAQLRRLINARVSM